MIVAISNWVGSESETLSIPELKPGMAELVNEGHASRDSRVTAHYKETP